MIMPIEEIVLRHGRQRNLDVASLACIGTAISPDGTIKVKLNVATETDQQYFLHPGDTFQVRDQTWKLDRVENADKPDWEVHLVRVA
jgi:hypothetical protein